MSGASSFVALGVPMSASSLLPPVVLACYDAVHFPTFSAELVLARGDGYRRRAIQWRTTRPPLPHWDMTPNFPGPDSPEFVAAFEAALRALAELTDLFNARAEGCIRRTPVPVVYLDFFPRQMPSRGSGTP